MDIVQSEPVWVALAGMSKKGSSVSSLAKEVTWSWIVEDPGGVVISIAIMIAGKPFSVAKTHTEHSVSIWARTQNKNSLSG